MNPLLPYRSVGGVGVREGTLSEPRSSTNYTAGALSPMFTVALPGTRCRSQQTEEEARCAGPGVAT